MKRAVFETLRTYGRKIFRWPEHFKRLKASVAGAGFKLAKSAAVIEGELQKALGGVKGEARLRVIVSARTVTVMAEPLAEKPKAYYQKGIAVVGFYAERRQPEVKWWQDAMCVKAKAYAVEQGAYEALLVNRKGRVPECAQANVFWVKNGKLFTPARGMLKGVTRDFVIELVGGQCAYRTPTLLELMEADEVFITQTSSGILPVVRIDGEKVGMGKPGAITRRLLGAFRVV